VRRDDVEVARQPMTFAGEPSQYAARWHPEAAGTYLLEVWAYHPASGNTGIDRTSVIVAE
jgi:hypothetical protein